MVMILDPKLTFTPAETAELNKRGKEYKEILGIDIRYCKACEHHIVFRSMHLVHGGSSLANG
jgi:hypothetical protein